MIYIFLLLLLKDRAISLVIPSMVTSAKI